MKLTASNIYQLWTEDRSRPDSAVRLRLFDFAFREKGQRSTPLCFPFSDGPVLNSLLGNQDPPEVEIAIMQAVTQLDRATNEWGLRLLVCRVVNEDFERQYTRTRLEGFATSGSMCVTSSRCDIPAGRSVRGVPFHYEVTPGRVGVYEADRVNVRYGKEGAGEPLRSLTGWVEDHPRNDSMKRLVAVSELMDLDYFVRKEMALQAKENQNG